MGTEKRRYGDWQALDRLGAGGQGEVFLARRLPPDEYARLSVRLQEAIQIQQTVHVGTRGTSEPLIAPLLDVLGLFARSEAGALKVLRDPESAKNPKTAHHRFRQEVQSLQRVSHPALIRVLDSDVDKRWFVMEYHAQGPLSKHQGTYKGDWLRALRALRPIVEAVAMLHEEGLVHRDIKPDNIFVADDGHLVLGDFGLVVEQVQENDRVTETYENVGSSAWMPAWAYGKRLDEVPTAFDVFTLGKVLWAMLSGKSFLRFHYFGSPEFDLEKLFPDVPEMKVANALLEKCVTDRVDSCLANGRLLLAEIDEALGVEGSAHGSERREPMGMRAESVEAMIGRLKTYLVEDRYRIQLEELVSQEVETTCEALGTDRFAVDEDCSDDVLVRRVAEYEEAVVRLGHVLATGCYWGTDTQVPLWAQALERVGMHEEYGGGLVVWLHLRLYPVLVQLAINSDTP